MGGASRFFCSITFEISKSFLTWIGPLYALSLVFRTAIFPGLHFVQNFLQLSAGRHV